MTSRLLVSLSDSPTPPDADHELLIAFHFGDGPPSANQPGVVRTRLSPVDRGELYECWWVSGDVEHSSQGPMRVAECDDFAVVVFDGDEQEPGSFEDYTRAAYKSVLDAVQSTQHPSLLRIWNYMGGINEGDGDNERYRQFSVGRAIAFDEAGLRDTHAPTATGVGTNDARGLTTITLSSKRQSSLCENPRQINAFEYPRQYGPRSPKFGRAASLDMQTYRLCLISGTASIVGHESLHHGDTKAQLDETLRNLEVLCNEFSVVNPGWPPLILGDRSILRVYLRDPGDHEQVARQLDESLDPGTFEAVYLRADICRRELMIEIDGQQVR